ncbi:hypothetical protein ACN2WE_35915 [Streptomyces sp. cg28]|uniref:hypothetical protein n=1 Tax=Streptomyces sp. cg28 TaxID=3403457 RepID=UPI003B224C2A
MTPRTVLDWTSILLATVVATASVTAPAHGHGGGAALAQGARCVGGEGRDSTSHSAVDGREIRWTEESKYDSARKHAHKAWTGNGLSQIAVRPDAWNTNNDLIWKDKNKRDKALATYARYPAAGATDEIRMNDYYLKSGRPGYYDSPEWRRIAAAHEYGHALGLCHKNPDQGSTLMSRDIEGTWGEVPTERDRRDYHRIWGNR